MDWLAPWVPLIAGLGGLAGLGALLKVFFDRKATLYTQFNALVDQFQEDRKEDRGERKELNAKVERVLDLYHLERDYSTKLLAWGLAGAPPPPPEREKPTTTE